MKLSPKIRNFIVIALVVLMAASYVYENYISQPETVDGEIRIHSIDVGQGDSTLVMAPGGNLLIDAGTNSSEDDLIAYLESVGVYEIEYFILTHPHEDHIGGADAVIGACKVKNVIMTEFTSSSRTYENVLDALEASTDTNVIECEAGAEYNIGEMKIRLLGPDPDDLGNDTNNSSIITKITYGRTSMLFTGDAEAAVESDLIEIWGGELDCDFMKLGHHGSTTSNTDGFMDIVTPYIASISCGVDNSYGHPHREILEMLGERNIEYYRTDEMGDIVFVCDGEKIYKK